MTSEMIPEKPGAKLWSLLGKAIVRLLYLTPIGFLLTTIYLREGSAMPGIIFTNSRVFIKQNPTLEDRLNWFINGLFLFAEAWIAFIIWMPLSYFIFSAGVVGIVVSIYPPFNWNKKLPIPLILIIIILFMAFPVLLLIIEFLMKKGFFPQVI